MANEEVKNPIDCLYDENNNDPIVLFNEKGEEIAFEQIALIPSAKAMIKQLKSKNTSSIMKKTSASEPKSAGVIFRPALRFLCF